MFSPEPAPSTAVVTVVAGRHQHLRRQREFLSRSATPVLTHVIVAIDDPGVSALVADCPELPSVVVTFAGTPAGLPVAAARNAGARAALAAGARTLIFLDVDCVPDPDLVGGYEAALGAAPDAVLCGAVTYLPPVAADSWRPTADFLRARRAPHPARPDPAPGRRAPADPALFWSLSFAMRATTWPRLPGFYEGYVGYGAEDTDFARTVTAAGVDIAFVGGADAYHQHHAVSSPPVEHLDDIVRNSAVFARRHGDLPMGGWLAAFAEQGLTTTAADRPRRMAPVRVATIPARHPYLDAVVPGVVERVDVQRTVGWEPDPLFRADTLRAAAPGVDVVHLHFGYDFLTPEALTAWLTLLRELRLPLVLTVHDLRNPHHEERTRHDEHLRLLVAAAARVLTLTDAAAAECAGRFGRRPEVVPHPTLLDGDDVPAAATAGTVFLPLKALRRNVLDAGGIARAVAEGAARAGLRARVLLEPSVRERPEAVAVQRLAADGALDLDLAPYLPADRLHAQVAAAHALVLPYRFGTHSGWVELARDLGVHAIVPDCGHYAAQWPDVLTYGNNETDGLDAVSLRDAVTRAGRRPRLAPAPRTARLAQRDVVRAVHDRLYRDVVAGRR